MTTSEAGGESDLASRVAQALPRARGLYWGGEWHEPADAAQFKSVSPPTESTLCTVLAARACVRASTAIAREEILGPALSVLAWKDDDALFDEVNGIELGLTASIWATDLVTAHRSAARVQAGYIWINDCSARITGAPFGGYKLSGMGREGSKEELFEFTQTKNVNVSLRR